MQNKYLIYLLFYLQFSYPFSNTDNLKNVFDINCAQNIEIIYFDDLQDDKPYGKLPYCLKSEHLSALNSTLDWQNFQSYGIKNQKSVYLAKINNAFIAPSYLGTVFDYEQQFLFDLFVSPGYPIFWPIGNEIKNFSVINYKKIATVQGPTYFYHWIIDRLPSVLLLRQHIIDDPDMMFLVNNQIGRVSGYVVEYLELLGIPAQKIIVAEQDVIYHADEVHFATPFLMEPIPKKLLINLRNELLQGAKKHKKSREYKDNLVVIIQRTEPDRRIENLSSLIELINSKFEGKDYELLLFDAKMPVHEQIEIFNNARVVIGVMASGLTNIIFCKPETTIIEIHPAMSHLPAIINAGVEWCWWLASAIDAYYWVILSPFNLSDANVICPMDDMRKILEHCDIT